MEREGSRQIAILCLVRADNIERKEKPNKGTMLLCCKISCRLLLKQCTNVQLANFQSDQFIMEEDKSRQIAILCHVRADNIKGLHLSSQTLHIPSTL